MDSVFSYLDLGCHVDLDSIDTFAILSGLILLLNSNRRQIATYILGKRTCTSS